MCLSQESKSLGISLLGAPFFAAPSIFGQTFPTVPTFTAMNQRHKETEHKEREWDPCILRTECLTAKLMFLHKSAFKTASSKENSVSHSRTCSIHAEWITRGGGK